MSVSTYLGLGQQEVSVDGPKNAPRSVPAERAGRGEGSLKSRPRETDDKVETPASGGCEAHPGVADSEREGLAGIGKWNGAL